MYAMVNVLYMYKDQCIYIHIIVYIYILYVIDGYIYILYMHRSRLDRYELLIRHFWFTYIYTRPSNLCCYHHIFF